MFNRRPKKIGSTRFVQRLCGQLAAHPSQATVSNCRGLRLFVLLLQAGSQHRTEGEDDGLCNSVLKDIHELETNNHLLARIALLPHVDGPDKEGLGVVHLLHRRSVPMCGRNSLHNCFRQQCARSRHQGTKNRFLNLFSPMNHGLLAPEGLGIGHSPFSLFLPQKVVSAI
jgi:hypothetical protein